MSVDPRAGTQQAQPGPAQPEAVDPETDPVAAGEDVPMGASAPIGQDNPIGPAPGAVEDVPTGAAAPEARTPEGAAVGEPEDELELSLDEIAARAEQADHYLELAQRTKADFENYRKRAGREIAAAQQRGVAKLARELLPAVDNLDRALDAAQAAATAGLGTAPGDSAGLGAAPGDAQHRGEPTLVSGIKLVHAEVIAALARVGIERFSPEGEPFDPQHHEAVAQQPFEGARAGTVVEVYQRGYRLGDSVLRPARVLVAG